MSNIIQFHDRREASLSITRGVYLRITEQGIVEYGLEEVGAGDVPRLLQALFALSARLVEIHHE